MSATVNDRAVIGGNQPPDSIEFGKETMDALGAWLKETPVVQTEEEARAGKLLVDRASACIKDMEDERTGKVKPLNEEVKIINDSYRVVRDPLEKILQELKSRLDAYVRAEEAKRIAAAQEAKRKLQEAERRAREAEEAERSSKEEAASGVVIDTALATVIADGAFSDFRKAEREAARAEKETKVVIGGGFGRRLSLRTQEVLSVTNWNAAITEMGCTEAITEAILTSARAYRKATGDLPNGIVATQERKL